MEPRESTRAPPVSIAGEAYRPRPRSSIFWGKCCDTIRVGTWLVMDQAPPHTSKKTTAFIDKQPRLHVFHLPKYSPDWNPDEKVWNHLKHQELKSHQAKTKEELKQLTRRKLQSMAKRPHLMRGLFFRCCVAELFK